MLDFFKRKKTNQNSVLRNENRQHERFSITIDAQIKVMIATDSDSKVRREIMYIHTTARTKNISIGGILLSIEAPTNEEELCLLMQDQMASLAGRPIEVRLTEKNIILWGEIVRTGAENNELAVTITKVSNVQGWKQTCLDHQEGFSIFPDTLRVRRKRRSGACDEPLKCALQQVKK